MERREFLKRAGLVAGAATLGGGLVSACSGKSSPLRFDTVLNHRPGDSPRSERLQALTQTRFPEVEAPPWILPWRASLGPRGAGHSWVCARAECTWNAF